MDWISNFYAPECEHIRSDSVGSQCRGIGDPELVLQNLEPLQEDQLRSVFPVFSVN